MLLIDCDSREIKPFDSETGRYTALTYVWGATSSKVKYNLKRVPSDIPDVIKDAIHVTKGIGLRYLWVDRYCITTDAPKIKHNQLQNMDQVYANAEVTSLVNKPVSQSSAEEIWPTDWLTGDHPTD
jgi:hypothetical protein